MWTVWIALLFWAAPTQGVSTTCEIPAVEKLQNTSLTCKFSEDISKRKQDFEVHFYKNNTTDSSETILRCYWIGNKLECRVHSCCEYDGHVTANLTVRVLSVTDTRVGRYVCFVLPASPDGNTFCNFTLRVTDKITDTSGGNLAALAVLVVIPVIICIIIIIIVWKRKCSKKPEDKMMKKKTCHFCPVQRYSKEKETVEGKVNEAKQSLIEENDSSQSTNIPDSKDRSFEKDLKSTDPMTAEKFGQKSDNTNGSHRHVHTSIIENVVTFFGNLFRREQVNRNAVPSCTPHQELSIEKIESLSTSVTGRETNPQEIENGQTDVDKTNVSDVSNEKALNKQALSESGTNVSSSGNKETVTQSQKMHHPSDQNDVNTPIAEQPCDDGTRTTRKTSQTGVNEFQTENETKDQKTQESDVYKYTTNITKEGKKAKSVRIAAEKKEKEAQDKAEKDEKIAKDKAEIEIKSAREKAEKEEKLVKENAEKEETIVKGKAEGLEKIAKEKAEREEKVANEKAKEEEKIAKDKAEKEESVTKRTSKKMSNTSVNIEEKVKKISNKKEDQMTKIAKSKEEQMEIIAKEREKQLEKIAKEKREELEKIANAREKRLEEISKRKTEEIEQIKKRKEEEIDEIKKVRKERIQTIIKEKDEQIEKIYKNKEEKRKKKENKQKKKGKENKQTPVRESHDVQKNDEQLKINEIEDDDYEADETEPCLDTNSSDVQVSPATRSQSAPHTIIQMSELASHQDVLHHCVFIFNTNSVQGSDEQSKEKESEDDDCGVELAKETDPCLTTKYSNVQVNPATRNQITTDTAIIRSELARHQDKSEAPTRTHDQTSQAVDKFGTHFKKNNEDIESNGSTTSHSKCAVS